MQTKNTGSLLHSRPALKSTPTLLSGWLVSIFITICLAIPTRGQFGHLDNLTLAGQITISGSFPNGIGTMMSAPRPTGPWQILSNNFYLIGGAGQLDLLMSKSNEFFRLASVDVSATLVGFTNLFHSYGQIHTIAGKGQFGVDLINNWKTNFEGKFATNANLSRPHYAMADRAGNVYIIDKDSDSLLKVTPDGILHTIAGTHKIGNGVDYATNALTVALSSPNGLWVRDDGLAYILDTDNGKVRRLNTNGTLQTLFTNGSPIKIGRGLWVRADETAAIFCAGKDLKRWTPNNGVKTLVNNAFVQLGNIAVDSNEDALVTDRGGNKLYRVVTKGHNAGVVTLLGGDGKTHPVVDNTLVLTNSLYGVRGVWLVPTGGYLLALHEGNQIDYVDSAGIIHVLINGLKSPNHSGDGKWFHTPGYPIAEARSVTLDYQGNMLLCENDNGFIRRIDFHRLFW